MDGVSDQAAYTSSRTAGHNTLVRLTCVLSVISVPKLGTEKYFEENQNDLMNAIQSIPAYIERCSHCSLLEAIFPIQMHHHAALHLILCFPARPLLWQLSRLCRR